MGWVMESRRIWAHGVWEKGIFEIVFSEDKCKWYQRTPDYAISTNAVCLV